MFCFDILLISKPLNKTENEIILLCIYSLKSIYALGLCLFSQKKKDSTFLWGCPLTFLVWFHKQIQNKKRNRRAVVLYRAVLLQHIARSLMVCQWDVGGEITLSQFIFFFNIFPEPLFAFISLQKFL